MNRFKLLPRHSVTNFWRISYGALFFNTYTDTDTEGELFFTVERVKRKNMGRMAKNKIPYDIVHDRKQDYQEHMTKHEKMFMPSQKKQPPVCLSPMYRSFAPKLFGKCPRNAFHICKRGIWLQWFCTCHWFDSRSVS